MLERMLAVAFWTTLLPLLAAPVLHRYRSNIYDPRLVYYTPNKDVGLFPRIFNLAKHANVSVNGTCGSNRPEVFCRQPTDKGARKANQCIPTLCDPKKNGIRKATDGSKDSWISPTLENGLEYEYITITLDLKQIYQVAYVTLKAGLAPLPAAWILERSIDGVTFSPWQYFAENDAECRRRFGIPATQGKPHYKTDDEVICLINYAKLYHIENGEILTSLLNGRPGLNFSSDTLKNFTLARYVRFRLQKIYKTERDLALRKKLFYSIKTISIGGQCLCHGHASKCVPNRITGLPTCECEHNTCGRHCEECCPLFNQVLWRPGTFDSAEQCEPCECHGHSDTCIYDSELAQAKLSLDTNGEYIGGGRCLKCQNHTTGINCERCEKGWYKPKNVSPFDPSPCLPCDCHPLGSTGVCAHDDSDIAKLAGWCECKEGYSGMKCDECAPGWRNFPDCEPCPCDSRGSLKKETCSIPCSCKANVEGKHCDKCRLGYFGLSADNPEGCIKCYCSGVAESCQEANLTYHTIESSLEGWKITDLSTTRTIEPTEDPDFNALFIGNYELPGVESYYWSAPSTFCGNQISAYGRMTLTFNVGWEAMRGDTSGQPTVGPNVILVGKNRVRLGLGEQIFEGRKGNATLRAPFKEEAWYTIPPEVKDIRTRLRRTEYRGATITRDKFLSVLANIKHVMLRAKFHTDQVEGSLLSVKMEPILDDITLKRFLPEKCWCPPQYEGLSCESCAFSHYKDTNFSFDVPFQCVPCPCNSHSECSPDGVCKKCEHNTEGDQCEFCQEGFYGNASMGTPNDCKPCACPLLEVTNNFSPTCEIQMDENNLNVSDQYVCNNCPIGYIGDHCEMCNDSYFGNPMEIGGSCELCDCKGGICDNVTGECLECSDNTEGIRCETCKPFYYRNSNSTCISCDCDAQGSEEQSCNIETGQCKCRIEYIGRGCNMCANGYSFSDGVCEKCNCGLGAKTEMCDPVTGECDCKPGTLTPKCDQCEPLHYGLSADGCEGCGCYGHGSEDTACDIISGQCHCKPNVTGRICDQCKVHHWGISTGQGCRPCDCDPLGSVSFSCDIETGQCICKTGVSGLKCETCLPNHYGFSINGCSRCQECKLQGHICDPETGRCVCPPFTQGEDCQTCMPNAWGYQVFKGCVPCNCDSGGSSKSQCDFYTGKCSCRKGFRGTRCDSCDHGFYNFPFCKSCDCNFGGTLNDTCDPNTGTCQCNERGKCLCKPNVIGKRCDVCKNGTFGIQAENPNGCTACFCFGRSASCTQAGLHWSQIRSGRSRSVFIEYDPSSSFRNTLPIDSQQICYINLAIPGGKEITLNDAERNLNVTNNLRTIPGDTEDVKIGVNYLFDTPIYWKLPYQFLGDKVLSYGGYLKFLVEVEGGKTSLPPTVLSTYPLVQLQGNSKIILEHFPLLPNKHARQEIRFHESLWREKNHPDRKVSRETLMVALQNIQHILIRATDSVDFNKATLKDVSLDTAAASNGLALAGGVELCECPPEYNSTSCQDPSIGFYRWYDKDVNTATILIQLVGEARPCECNNRSEICDIETGFCQNCAHNTGGRYCEQCAKGYYGDPAVGPCLSCPCPKAERNFAEACHVHLGRETFCKCKEGYTGRYCDRCAYGWFGYPEKEGGFCQPCNCNPYGSVSDECDEKTGQCNCRVGIEGRNCSKCPGKTVLTSKGCSTCVNECTEILLKDFEELSESTEFRASNVLNKTEPPWVELNEIEKKLLSIKKNFRDWDRLTRSFDNMVESQIPFNLNTKAKELIKKAQVIENRCNLAKSESARLRKESEEMFKKIQDIKDDIEKTAEYLNVYSKGEGNFISDSVALMEARQLLEEITKRQFQPQKQLAEQVLDYCTGILNKTMHMNERFPEIWEMREQLKNVQEKIEELEMYITKSIDISDMSTRQIGDYREKIKHLQNKLSQITANLKSIEDIRNNANTLLYDADLYLTEVEENLKNISAIKPRLKNATDVLLSKEGIFENLNPLYKNKYVKPAQIHAAYLMEKVQELKNLFNATSKGASVAVEASKAYQDIVDNIETAKKAAKEALESELMYKIFPPEFDQTILERSDVVKALSTRLINSGTTQSQQNLDLRKKLEDEKYTVSKIEDTVRQTGLADNKLSGELENLENNPVKDQVQVALDKVGDLERNIEKANKKIEIIKNNVVNKLKPKLDFLADKDELFSIEKAGNEIRDSLVTNRRVLDLLIRVNKTINDKLKKPSFQMLPKKLADLKNKITEARHAAESIRLSLSSKPAKGCVRSFKVSNLEPTTTSRLVVTMTVDPTLSNRIIFFLPSSTTSDFMALELVDGHVRFVWNNGGGPGTISKSLMEETKKNGPQWFKIVIERISYTGRLWVYTENSKINEVVPISNASNPNFGRMDAGPNDKVWVGGLPNNYEKPAEILSIQQGLPGCLHSITLDDRPIGLWNHYMDSTDACTACEKGIDDVLDSSTYSFNGKGYSVLKHAPKSTYNRYQFSIALKFRTFDDNSILFVAISADKTRYASLILRNGRVVFQIGYGGESQLEMSSSKKYNDGNWTVVEASRNFDRRRIIEKGLLKVGDEMKEAAPPTPPMQSQIPELATADYLVGGFPPGYNFGSLNFRLPMPFLGCLAELFIDKDIYNPLKGKTNGVGSSCADKVLKKAGFHGKGYLKLEATRLKKDSAFGLALRTLQPNALVLLANGHKIPDNKELENEISNNVEIQLPEERKKENYYSMSLVNGRIEVRIDAGRGTITLVSQIICNDGRFHSISVAKIGRKLELRVDDEFQSASTLPGGSITVKAKDLYLGGVPDDIDASKYSSDVTPFVGTIKDLLFNYILKQFDKPIDFVNVDIGRFGPEKTDNMTLIQNSRLPPQNHFQCYRSRKYALDPRAVKFGDSLNSHIKMNLRRRGIFQKNYSIEFNFRTFHPSGILFIIPGVNKSGKQKHFLISALRKGQLLLIVKTKRKLEISSDKVLDNGNWNKVLITREERRLTMFINEHDFRRLKLPKRVNLGNFIYFGGTPEGGISDPFISKFQEFTGCLKNLKINNQTEDLIGEKSLHQGVGQCFPTIEKGSYFSGDAYIAHKKDFTIESLLKMKLEFRTSEMNGILLSITDFVEQSSLSLEINNGQIIFMGDFDGNHKFRLTYEFISAFVVCDNKWHKIEITYRENQIIMMVDQNEMKQDFESGSFLTYVISAPLFIGGLPEHTPGERLIPETLDNFKGCMRNIMVGDENIDFTVIVMRHNVLIGSCPANNNH